MTPSSEQYAHESGREKCATREAAHSSSVRGTSSRLTATADMRLVVARHWLSRAKIEIGKGEMSFRAAAEHIGKAEALGASQREIADGVGKSAAWVNQMLQWRKSGYEAATPFGPSSRASRQRRLGHVQAPERSQAHRSLQPQTGAMTNLVRNEGVRALDNASDISAATVDDETQRNPKDGEPLENTSTVASLMTGRKLNSDMPAFPNDCHLGAHDDYIYVRILERWKTEGLLTQNDWAAASAEVRERAVDQKRLGYSGYSVVIHLVLDCSESRPPGI